MAEAIPDLDRALSPGAEGVAKRGLAESSEHAELAYAELRQLAEQCMRGERADHTLQATALVHEAYLRILERRRTPWRDRAHFVATAARTLRHVLVDHARGVRSVKRGGGRARIPLDDDRLEAPSQAVAGTSNASAAAAEGKRGSKSGLGGHCDLLTLNDALERLEEHDPDKAKVVELRFFAGLTMDEIASVLGITTRSVERRWEFARAWLYREIDRGC